MSEIASIFEAHFTAATSTQRVISISLIFSLKKENIGNKNLYYHPESGVLPPACRAVLLQSASDEGELLFRRELGGLRGTEAR